MKKTITIISIIITILCINKIPDNDKEMIRFRIIANSNSIEDQKLKKKVLKEVSKNIINKNIKTIDEERKFIKSNIPLIEEDVKKNTLDYKINYGKNYFPTKKYNEKIYPEGYYESLVITLGDGSGENFWCILFPPLCMIDEDENIEYKSFIKEAINKYF